MPAASSRLGRSALWSMSGSGAQYAVVFVLLIYLAHILRPRDFGLMAMVAVGLDLGTRIARWGQVELLQQPRFRTDEARTQSLKLSLAIGLAFAMTFVAIARPMGRLYGSPELATMMLLCAPVFVFSATSSAAEAILRSEFRFRALAFRNTVTTVIGAIVAVVMVKLGYGSVTLAVQRLVQAALSSAYIWNAVSWRPRLFARDAWSGAMAREGASVMVGTVLPLVVPRAMDFFVGFVLGPAQLGMMRIAFRINDFVGQLVVMPLVSVANAQLSGHGGDPAGMRRPYLRLTQASAALMCPVLIGMTLVAPEAVPILFGGQWRACVPLVQILGLLGLVSPINYYFPAAMIALGRSRLVLQQGVAQIALGVVLAAVAAQISLPAIAIAHVVRGLAVSVLNVRDLRREMGLTLRMLWQHMAVPYLATLAMAVAVIVTRALLPPIAPLPRLVALGAVGVAGYGSMIWLGERLGLWPAHASLVPARFRRGRIASPAL